MFVKTSLKLNFTPEYFFKTNHLQNSCRIRIRQIMYCTVDPTGSRSATPWLTCLDHFRYLSLDVEGLQILEGAAHALAYILYKKAKAKEQTKKEKSQG